jgi:hypothetical protein
LESRFKRLTALGLVKTRKSIEVTQYGNAAEEERRVAEGSSPEVWQQSDVDDGERRRRRSRGVGKVAVRVRMRSFAKSVDRLATEEQCPILQIPAWL